MGSCPGSCGFGKVRLQEKVQIGHIYSKVLSVMEGFLEEVVNEFGVRVFGDRKDDLWGRLGYPTPSRVARHPAGFLHTHVLQLPSWTPKTYFRTPTSWDHHPQTATSIPG